MRNFDIQTSISNIKDFLWYNSKKRYLLLFIVVSIISILVLLSTLWNSSQEIDSIEIFGLKTFEKEEVKALIKTPYQGMSKSEIDIANIKKELCNHLYINEANVELTNGNTLEIYITELQPLGLAQSSKGKFYFIGDNATIVEARRVRNYLSLPLVKGVSLFPGIDSTRRIRALKGIKKIHNILNSDKYKPFYNLLTEIRFNKNTKEFSIVLSENSILVKLGNTSSLDKKFDKLKLFWLKHMLMHGNNEDLKYIDVRWVDRIIIS